MIGRFMSAVFVYSQFKEAKTFSHKDGTCSEHAGGMHTLSPFVNIPIT